jgi:hypothetical protein
VRFVFTPPAAEAAGLLTLPWSEPLEEWKDERLVETRQRGISRHVAASSRTMNRPWQKELRQVRRTGTSG